MPFRRAWGRKRAIRRPRRRYRRRRGRLARVPRPLRPGIYPMVKSYQTTIIGSGASSIDFSDNISLSKVDGYAGLAAVFQQYRILCAVVTITCPYVTPLASVRYKPKQLSDEGVPSSTGAWGELNHKRRLFTPLNGNRVSCKLTPRTWERQEVVPGSANMRDRAMFKQWYTCPTSVAYSMQFSGLIAQITNLDGSVLPSSDVFQVETKLYLQFKSAI